MNREEIREKGEIKSHHYNPLHYIRRDMKYRDGDVQKIVDILYVMIIMSFISLIQGKINNNIEGLSTIPSSRNELENIFTDESSKSTNIKTSSYPSDLSTPTPEIIDNLKDTKSDISLSSSFKDDKTDIIVFFK